MAVLFVGRSNVSGMVGSVGVSKPKILFLITEDWYFWSHRLSLARGARDAGFQVLVVTRVNQHGNLIEKEGFKLVPVSLVRRSRNPLRELRTISQLIRIYRRERPDLVHHVAIKPILYGSLAARIAKVPAVVNALAGLGYMFTGERSRIGFVKKFINIAYRAAFFSKNSKVIFQNPDDASVFLNAGIVNSRDIAIIRGSGADLSYFLPIPEAQGVPLVVLASRMLWDKGAKEFVEAAKILRVSGVKARFALVGENDPHNPASVKTEQLEFWRNDGAVEWWGRRDDMLSVFSQSNLVCLPSYREGVPKVLIEAAACARAIVTTDAPGCREIVRHGENGFLVPVRDSKALAGALQKLIEAPELRARMGARGREIAVAEFSDKKVVAETLSIYRQLLDQKS